MTKTKARIVFMILLALTSLSEGHAMAANPLPSWQDGATKSAILGFVTRVTDKNSTDFVRPENRIATFDNDGTCWVEKPLYVHLFANLDRFQELMEADPKLADKQPFKAFASKDVGYFMDLLEKGETGTIISDAFGVPFEGLTTQDFNQWNRKWLTNWKHPRFKVGYRNLVYQPMVELIHYLRDNDFDVHIFTADEGAFLKLVATELYGIPPQHVHGSSIKLKYEVDGKGARLVRTAQSNYLDNWDGKPRLIYQAIGKRPIFAAGNSNGDLQMLQYTSQQTGPSMSVLVHHTDGEREYKYDKHTDKVMPLAKQAHWTVVNMQDDWKTVFSR